MTGRLDERRVVIALILAGVALGVAIAVATPESGDMQGFHAAVRVFDARGFSAYGGLDHVFAYPPGSMPWLLLSAHFPGSSFAVLERLLPITANAVIAWLVFLELRARQAPRELVIAAVALIAFGPVFIAVAADNGQLDGVAFVFVLLAVRAWRTVPLRRRAIVAGLLVGAGGTIKTVPLIFIFAFLPTVTDRREGVRLVLSAAVVPALALLPFVIADAAGVRNALSYSGQQGGGGLTLLADPGLAKHYLSDYDLRVSGVAGWLERHGLWITLAAVIIAAAWLRRARLAPLDASVVLAIATLLFSVNFYEQYLLWLLPFALASGRIVLSAVLEAIIFLYIWVVGDLTYFGPLRSWGVSTRATIQVACVVALLVVLAVALTRLVRAPGVPMRSGPR